MAARGDLFMCGCMKLRENRKEKQAALRANGFDCNPASENMPGYVARLSRARFVFSPRGHGFTNHRDWEALSAGAVPLVDSHEAIAPLYVGLPVIQIPPPNGTRHGYDDGSVKGAGEWGRVVTREFLEAEWARLSRPEVANSFDVSKVYWPYWLAQLVAGGGAGEAKGAATPASRRRASARRSPRV